MQLATVGPQVDYAGLSPLIALATGVCVVLLIGVLPGALKQARWSRRLIPALALTTLSAAASLAIWQWSSQERLILSGALKVDDLALALDALFFIAAAATVLLSLSEKAVEESGRGEYFALLLAAVLGMTVLAAAENIITFFIGLELLSIPLYLLCASRVSSRTALESGLKYLIVGSLGAATLLYGLALIYGATGATDFGEITAKITKAGLVKDPLVLTGTALIVTGLAFKASVAPFHQWTPDVYQGAPTPVTAFMAVATKAAAFVAFLRLFYLALPELVDLWAPVLAGIALLTMVIGNVGAIGQDSMKRMLGYSGVAQAGYMLVGVVVGSELGASSLVLYLAAYLLMNLAAFAVVRERERETQLGDSITALEGLGSSRPLLATVMTVAMLSLAGFPATVGFIGKFYLIRAAVEGDYTWLGVAIVLATVISLVYYLRVVAVMWMMPSRQASTTGEASADPLAASIAGAAMALAVVAFGIVPQPLIDVATHAGRSLLSLSGQ